MRLAVEAQYRYDTSSFGSLALMVIDDPIVSKWKSYRYLIIARCRLPIHLSSRIMGFGCIFRPEQLGPEHRGIGRTYTVGTSDEIRIQLTITLFMNRICHTKQPMRFEAERYGKKETREDILLRTICCFVLRSVYSARKWPFYRSAKVNIDVLRWKQGTRRTSEAYSMVITARCDTNAPG